MKNFKLRTRNKIDKEDMKILYDIMNKFSEEERLLFYLYFISDLDNELTTLENIESKLNGIFPASDTYDFLTDEHESSIELEVKELLENESTNIIFNSWELVNSNVALKTLDRSAYLYKMTGVPMGIRSFFDKKLQKNDSKEIKLIYKNIEYYADFELDDFVNPRSRIRWGNDFGDLIKDVLPEYYDIFNNKKDTKNLVLPKMKFEKLKEDSYLIDFII